MNKSTLLYFYGVEATGLKNWITIASIWVTLVGFILKTAMLGTAMLLLYLSYYILSVYIQQLEIIVSNIDENKLKQIGINKKNLKMLGYLFDCLCQAAAEINQLFFMPAFIIVTVKIITAAFTFFLFIFTFFVKTQ